MNANPVSDRILAVTTEWLQTLEDHYHPDERSGFPGAYEGMDWDERKTVFPLLRRLVLTSANAFPQHVEAYLRHLIGRPARSCPSTRCNLGCGPGPSDQAARGVGLGVVAGVIWSVGASSIAGPSSSAMPSICM